MFKCGGKKVTTIVSIVTHAYGHYIVTAVQAPSLLT